MRCSNVYEKKKFENVSSATLKIYWKNFNNIRATFREGLGFGVINLFSYLYVVAKYNFFMNKKIWKRVMCDVENMLEKFQQYLSDFAKVWVWGLGLLIFFLIYAL